MMQPDKAEAAYPCAKWDGLQVTLVRIYQGLARPPRMVVSNALATTVAFWRIKRGRATVELDGYRAQAGAGEWLICFPGQRLQCFEPDTHLLSIHLRVSSPGNLARWVGPRFVCPERPEPLNRAAEKLRNIAAKWNLCRDDFVEEQYVVPLPGALEIQTGMANLLLVLLGLLTSHAIRFEPLHCRDARVGEGLRWLAEQPLGQPFSRATLAALAGLSPSRLDRLWRDELGMTPFQYWESRRMKRACASLREPQRLIKEIAFELGFPHVSQFSTWFRMHQGESPRVFRSHPGPV